MPRPSLQAIGSTHAFFQKVFGKFRHGCLGVNSTYKVCVFCAEPENDDAPQAKHLYAQATFG